MERTLYRILGVLSSLSLVSITVLVGLVLFNWIINRREDSVYTALLFLIVLGGLILWLYSMPKKGLLRWFAEDGVYPAALFVSFFTISRLPHIWWLFLTPGAIAGSWFAQRAIRIRIKHLWPDLYENGKM